MTDTISRQAVLQTIRQLRSNEKAERENPHPGNVHALNFWDALNILEAEVLSLELRSGDLQT